MKIQKISIKHYRCFEEKEISFHPQFNVIIGENGSGKTAVLDAIASVLAPFINIFVNKTSFYIAEKDIRRTRFGSTKEVSNEDTCLLVSVKDIKKEDKNTYEWETKQNMRREYAGTSLLPEEIKNLSKERNNLLIYSLPIIAYYPTDRTVPKTSEIDEQRTSPNDFREVGYKNALEGNGINIEEIAARIKTLDLDIYKVGTNPSKSAALSEKLSALKNQLNTIKQAVINCIPNCINIDFDFEWNELVIDLEGEEPRKPFSLLSEGFRNIIAIVADIAHRATRLNSHLGENILAETEGVVLIDEIDLHLHPRWQNTIVEDLQQTFPKIQFIVSTHSPLIIQDVTKEKVIFLDEKSDFEPNLLTPDSILIRLQGLEDVETEERKNKIQELAQIELKMKALKDKGEEENKQIQLLWNQFRKIAQRLDWNFQL